MRKLNYCPADNKIGIIFVDDLSMPKIESPGINDTQPPIELLRQWMDYEGWYEIFSDEKDFRKIRNFTFVAAMGPPGAGKNMVSMRYIRHFVTLYVEPYSDDSLQTIFSAVQEWSFL